MSCVVALVILSLSIMTIPSDSIPKPLKFEHADKIVHVFLYMALSMAICLDFFRQSVSFTSWKMYIWAIILPILYGGLIEILQEKYFSRTADWLDWAADIAGVCIGYFLSRLIYPRIVKPEKTDRSCGR